MDKIVAYLEKLGYSVEEQGKIEKYLVVFKEGRPIGFILNDLTVKLISDAGEQNDIRKIIEFLDCNQGLDSVGASEFQLANFKGSQMTTYFDVKSMRPAFAIYLRGADTGEVKSSTYNDFDTAVYSFVTKTQMIDLSKFSAQRESFGDRMRTRLIDYLLTKSKERAEQH